MPPMPPPQTQEPPLMKTGFTTHSLSTARAGGGGVVKGPTGLLRPFPVSPRHSLRIPTQKAPPWAIAWGPHSRNPATPLVTRLSAVSFPWAQIKSATDTATTAASNLDKNYGAPRPPKRARPGPSRKRAPCAHCWLIAWAGMVPLHGPDLPLLRPAVPSRVLVRGAVQASPPRSTRS